jgi:hypothetical protein
MVLGVEAKWGQSYLQPHPGEGIQTNLEAWHKQTARLRHHKISIANLLIRLIFEHFAALFALY